MSGQTDVLRRFLGGRPSSASRGEGGHVVAVGSGKGGTGASLVAALLALGAAQDGRRVLLVDTDPDVGTLHHLFGVVPRVPLAALRHTDVASAAMPVADGVTLLAGGGAETALSDVERRQLLRRAGEAFGDYDVVLLDAGSRLEAVLRAIAAGASRLLAVTTADAVAVAACYALVKATAARHPELAADVVLNGGDGAPARRAAEELAVAARRHLERRLDCLGFVPDDPSLRAALAAGMPLPDACAGSPVADHLRAIGSRFLTSADAPTRPVAARTA